MTAAEYSANTGQNISADESFRCAILFTLRDPASYQPTPVSSDTVTAIFRKISAMFTCEGFHGVDFYCFVSFDEPLTVEDQLTFATSHRCRYVTSCFSVLLPVHLKIKPGPAAQSRWARSWFTTTMVRHGK